MTSFSFHSQTKRTSQMGLWLMLAAYVLTIAVYWPGLSGNFLFDDYPNIVDNHGVQPTDASVSSLVGAALSSPSSELKRPLASLSFAANYLATGLDPYWMKLTNLVIHLLNGWLVFLLSRALLLVDASSRYQHARQRTVSLTAAATSSVMTLHPDGSHAEGYQTENIQAEADPTMATVYVVGAKRAGIVAALIAGSWMLLPINLTGVLYVVQRMESMANLFVLIGLIGYVAGRQRMLGTVPDQPSAIRGISPRMRGFLLCIFSITVPTAFGILAKETAVMLPLYAALIEWILFRFAKSNVRVGSNDSSARFDRQIITMILLVLVLPMALGLTWIVPSLLRPETWATRDFTLGTRLLSEARIVVDYIAWIVFPTPDALSFYHDDFLLSTGLLTPWSTLVSILALTGLLALMLSLRSRRPLTALGIALFLGCHLPTGTILPLELIYEHRNYFASFGLVLAIVPLLAAPRSDAFALPRHVLLGALLMCWAGLTALTAYSWGNPLRLAEELANRAPHSPRAQYELGRTYVIYSHYDPASPFTKLAYAPLERAAALPGASILPEQALIFMNSRMHLPLKDAWWDSMIGKLKEHKSGVQDESSLSALTQCDRETRCDLPIDRMMAAFMAALSHPNPSARLLATYGDYAWNVLNDQDLGLRMTREAVKSAPDEAAYQITLIRMLTAQNRTREANRSLRRLESLNIGGRLNSSLDELRKLPGLQ